MGLDTTHDCWHGAYSAFMRWRRKLAEVAGLPPLELMEGFYYPGEIGTLQAVRRALESGPLDFLADGIEELEKSLPISWDCLKPDILHELLFHSDCDGELAPEICGPLADRLEELLPLLPDDDDWGHIRNWRDKTQMFIDGLREAAAAGEPVGFR